MYKYLLVLLLMLLLSSTPCLAVANSDVKLQADFGRDLTKAPFFLRFAFSKEYDKDWENTDYDERRSFLQEYENNVIAQEAKDKADAKAAVAQARQAVLEQRAQQRAARAKLKADRDEAKAEADVEKERQKEFALSLKQQQKTLDQMEQEATRGSSAAASQAPPQEQGSGQ